MLPATAVKAAFVAPPGTFTAGGTVNVGVLLESVTVAPPEPAACDNATVQVEIPPEPMLDGLHDSRLTAVDVASRIGAVCELLL